ncbi:hypothetical protein [Paracoccus yeei]|uniref:hypothetical protein n=1 Tax=Paracoccus yeei TaxID=147645 RepID=UPI003BF7F331
MPNILDPRIITLTQEIRDLLSAVIYAEIALCRAVGASLSERPMVALASVPIAVERILPVLRQVEATKHAYLRELRAEELRTRTQRGDALPDIGLRSVSPPLLIGRNGAMDLTSENAREVIAAASEPCQRVTVREADAFRAGAVTWEEIEADFRERRERLRQTIANYEKDGHASRAADRMAQLSGIGDLHAMLAGVLPELNAAGIPVTLRLASGRSRHYRAIWSKTDDHPKIGVTFRVANVAIVRADPGCGIAQARSRRREGGLVRAGVIGRVGIHVPAVDMDRAGRILGKYAIPRPGQPGRGIA